MHTINHPLPVGAYVLSIEGESDSYIDDDNGDDIERHTGPNAIGRIVDVDDYTGNGQGWSYAVEFPGGCYVHIDEADSINDPTKYRVFDAARMFAEVDRLRGLLVNLRAAADALDSKLDDPHGDGSGRDAQPPDGDAYNDLHALIPSSADIQPPRV